MKKAFEIRRPQISLPGSSYFFFAAFFFVAFFFIGMVMFLLVERAPLIWRSRMGCSAYCVALLTTPRYWA